MRNTLRILCLCAVAVTTVTSPVDGAATTITSGHFQRDPSRDRIDHRERFLDPELGFEGFLRKSFKGVLRAYLATVGPEALDRTPKVYLHGNPNLGNFGALDHGCALLDFDKTRAGPYSWDVFRFLVDAGSIRYDAPAERVLSQHVTEPFEMGYLEGLRSTSDALAQAPSMIAVEKGETARSVKAHVKGNGRWMIEMSRHPIAEPASDPMIQELLSGYLQAIDKEDLLEEYFVAAAGQDQGKAIGVRERERFLLLLKPKDGDSGKKWYLLGIKETCPDGYRGLAISPWFDDPYSHHGDRMRHADAIYSPTDEFPIGPTSYKERPFYGRAMHLHGVKYERMLTDEELRELSYAIGAQLGRGHALSLRDGSTREQLEKHFIDHYRSLLLPSAVAVIEGAKSDYRNYIAACRK